MLAFCLGSPLLFGEDKALRSLDVSRRSRFWNSEPEDLFCSPCRPALFDKNPSGWFLGGHLESGLYVNQYGRRNVYRNGELDPDSGNSALLQNVRQSDFQLNQLYLKLGKELDTRHGFDFGGRVDLMYGTAASQQ